MSLVPRPRDESAGLTLTGCMFKIVALTLMMIDVVWHGLVALLVGGPLGFGVFLVMVAVVWVGPWVARWRQREAIEPDRNT